MAAFGIPGLSEAIRRFVAEQLPGRTPIRFVLYTYEDKDNPLSIPIVAPLPIAAARIAQDATDKEGESDSPSGRERFSACVTDILDVLRTAGHPMTATRILYELDKLKKYWSKRTVERYLAEMVRDGTLLNPPGVRPAGYRLPPVE